MENLKKEKLELEQQISVAIMQFSQKHDCEVEIELRKVYAGNKHDTRKVYIYDLFIKAVFLLLLSPTLGIAQQSIFVQPSLSLVQSPKTNAVRLLFEAGAYGFTAGIYHRRHLLGMEQDQNFNGLELKKYFGKQIGAFGSLQWERGYYYSRYRNRHAYGIGAFGKLENARFTAEYTPNAYKGASFTFGMGYVIDIWKFKQE